MLQQCRAAWARRGRQYDYIELIEMARQAPAFATILNIDDPIFFNSPDMPEAVATHCRRSGQPEPDGLGAAVRAILEGIALRYAVVFRQLQSVIGRNIERVHMVGGGARNELLCQFASDAMGVPVIAGPVEATAMGNLVLQALADGRLADHRAGRRVIAESSPLKAYEPNGCRAWRPVIERYEQIFKS